MTLRVSDWQSDIDLDSIRDSCDVYGSHINKDNLVFKFLFDSAEWNYKLTNSPCPMRKDYALIFLFSDKNEEIF